ncbi:hypothetical protein NE237_017870 [Protea cynaroides]|uniref:PUM-HD domain-containing protein n=1 Tax=Protea cynaroides TaxID=273540 RepID=A0A9Q0K8Y2_9MAGN|nr:hypothetical protein NE237_017870 [Protea cynaroides]
MGDQIHLSSLNRNTVSHADGSTSLENLITQFRNLNLFSSVTESVQNHDQTADETTNVQQEAIGLLGPAPLIPTYGIDTVQRRTLPGISSSHIPQQFSLLRSPNDVDLGLSPSYGYGSYYLNPIDSGSLSTQWNSFSSNLGRYMYPTSFGQNHSIGEDIIHGINGGFGGDWSAWSILNDVRLDCVDPTLFDELGKDQIVFLAKYLKGSQYLKRILDSKDVIVTVKILDAVISLNTVDLMTNEFGRQMFQKLVDSCNQQQVQVLVFKLATEKDALYSASIHKHGTHCVQKLIKTMKKSDFIAFIMQALAPKMLVLMKHQIGNHVIRACLENLDCHQNFIIFEVAKEKCLELATHAQGCLTLNYCIDYTTGAHRRELLNIIIDSSIFLAQEPYGNYVMQHVLNMHNPVVNSHICHKLQEVYIRLSMQKAGSHVVEACAKFGEIKCVVNGLVQSDKLVQVAKNPFGNYVIQTVIKATKNSYPEYYRSLEFALDPHLEELQYHPNGRNVYNLIKGRVPIS